MAVVTLLKQQGAKCVNVASADMLRTMQAVCASNPLVVAAARRLPALDQPMVQWCVQRVVFATSGMSVEDLTQKRGCNGMSNKELELDWCLHPPHCRQ